MTPASQTLGDSPGISRKPTLKLKKFLINLTRPEGLLDPKIRDEMSDFLEIFPTENQI